MDARSRPGPGQDDQRPGDQRPGEPCPDWCRRAHAAGDHPDDRHHQGEAELVALVTGCPMLEPDDRAHPVSVAARLVRRVGSDVTWLEVVSEEGREVRLVVTTESARRLVAVVSRLLSPAVT